MNTLTLDRSTEVSDCSSCPVLAGGGRRCAFTPCAFPAGSLVIAEGEASDRIYFVRQGLLALGPRSPGAALSLRGPRSLLGIEALRGERAPVEVWALTAVRLCALAVDRLPEWVEPGGAPARAMVELLADDVAHRAREQRLLQGPALSRLARLLLLVHAAPEPPRLEKQLLARLIGLRPETFSRNLRRLADDGLIDALSTEVLDPPALARLAG